MKKFILLIAVFIFFNLTCSPQNLPNSAVESPINCAFYLYSKDDDNSNREDLARTLFELKRYNDLLRLNDLTPENYDKIKLLSVYSTKLIENNNQKEANRFLSKAITVLKTDENESDFDSRNISAITSNLVKLSRFDEASEIFNQREDNTDKILIALNAARALQKINQTERAESFLQISLELAENQEDKDYFLLIAVVYSKLNKPDIANKILERIEKAAVIMIDESERNRLLLGLMSAYLQNNQPEKSFALWRQYGDVDDGNDALFFAKAVADYQGFDKAASYFLQIRQNADFVSRDGDRLVEIYLQQNDIETAISIAKTMSEKNDNYSRQKAFMLIADWFVKNGKNNSALEILNLAYQRAAKIAYVHNPQDSVGASSGSRKEIYLGQIYQRLIELKQFNQAFAVFSSINSEHIFAREFCAEHLVDFAKLQINSLPRKKIVDLLAQAQSIVKDDERDEYHEIDIKIRIADVYAQMNEKTKAVELLNEALVEGQESCCYEEEFLLQAAKIFESNNLKADTQMKKILTEYISED